MQQKWIEVDDLAKLVEIELSEKENQMISNELKDFLGYVQIIHEADLKKIADDHDKMALEMRPDCVAEYKNREKLLQAAPALQGSSYLVPPQEQQSYIEKESINENTRMAQDYEPVIGLEVHAQLKTQSKLFCSCSSTFGCAPNHNTCPICSGHPGELPVLNKEAVTMAIAAGLAIHCTIQPKSIFARKNYFYPDLPKGYQISQFEEPICTEGFIELEQGGKKIAVQRIHIEEDAGKMVHVGASGIWESKASAVDLNRAGVPLIEIVSKPELSTPKEAKLYVMRLRAILISLGICDGNMEQGSLRCDANISMRKTGTIELGTKIEIKNINSFKAIERALAYEIIRQQSLIGQGIALHQETRLWNEKKQKTMPMRGKEKSHDYRYLSEPDLPPLKISPEWIQKVKSQLPPLPDERKQHYMKDYQLTEKEADLLIQHPNYSNYFEQILAKTTPSRLVANFFFNNLLTYMGKRNEITLAPDDIAQLLRRIEKGEISGSMSKKILKKSFQTGRTLDDIIKEDGLKKPCSAKEIASIIEQVTSDHPDLVHSYRNGKTKVFGFFVGQVIKRSQGRGNPGMINQLLEERLSGKALR